MNEQIHKEELSILDLLKVLWKKVKLLILVCICGGIVGGTFGVLTTYRENYWGTPKKVKFYVNPERPESDDDSINLGGSTYGVYGAYGRHVMDNIINLLNDDIFAEQLLLNGSRIPEKDVWVNENIEDEVALGLNDKIDDAAAKLDVADTKLALYETALSDRDSTELAYREAYQLLQTLWRENPYADRKVSNANFNENDYITVKNHYPELDVAYIAMHQANDAWETAKANYTKQKNDYASSKKEADEAVTIVLKAWRKTTKYQNSLKKILDAAEFSYVENDSDLQDAANLARSFIYVDISVLGDENKEFAEELLDRIKTVLPPYVCDKMIVPDGYSGTSCMETTTTSKIDLTNPLYTTKSAIKYAILLAFASFSIACVLIIVLDRADKRVRDYDQVARTLNVPLLGVIPSIDEEKITAWNKKLNEKQGV